MDLSGKDCDKECIINEYKQLEKQLKDTDYTTLEELPQLFRMKIGYFSLFVKKYDDYEEIITDTLLSKRERVISQYTVAEYKKFCESEYESYIEYITNKYTLLQYLEDEEEGDPIIVYQQDFPVETYVNKIASGTGALAEYTMYMIKKYNESPLSITDKTDIATKRSRVETDLKEEEIVQKRDKKIIYDSDLLNSNNDLLTKRGVLYVTYLPDLSKEEFKEAFPRLFTENSKH